jgi:xanthine dehydrogenase accessory factor
MPFLTCYNAGMDFWKRAAQLNAAGTRAVLATVVHATGSTPQKAGARALFEAGGAVHGTLGGGCLEAEARQRALHALDTGQPAAFDLRLDDIDGWDDGLVCGGKVRIFVDPHWSQSADAYESARAARKDRKPGTLVTALAHPQLRAGHVAWVPEGGTLPVDFATGTHPAKGPRHLLQAEAEWLLEPVVPAPRLVIAGAGHIGKALAHFGALLDFEVTVVDDRPAFANPANLPEATHIHCGDIAEELTRLALDAQSFVAIVTRGHRHDAQALAACIHAPVAYLGLIGSRRKSLLLRRRLVEEGLATEAEIARVVTPMGLDLGGQSVQEIALSIAAQLVAVRHRGVAEAGALRVPFELPARAKVPSGPPES